MRAGGAKQIEEGAFGAVGYQQVWGLHMQWQHGLEGVVSNRPPDVSQNCRDEDCTLLLRFEREGKRGVAAASVLWDVDRHPGGRQVFRYAIGRAPTALKLLANTQRGRARVDERSLRSICTRSCTGVER